MPRVVIEFTWWGLAETALLYLLGAALLGLLIIAAIPLLALFAS